MWNLTASEAAFWFSASNLVLIVGAFGVLIGTIGVVETTKAREHFSDVRISENERVTQTARVEAATANAGLAKATSDIANANRDAASAEVVAARANERAASLEKDAAVAP